MRIAQIAPLHEAVPPKFYGGTERVVSYLTEALVEAGHDVTLFASGDSQTSAKLEAFWPQALRLDPTIRDTMAPHMLLLEEVRRRADEFDVLHFHIDYYPFSLFSRQPVPFLTTMHGRLDLPELQPIFSTFNEAPVVSTSDIKPTGSRPFITACPKTCSSRSRTSNRVTSRSSAGFRRKSVSTGRSVLPAQRA